MDLSLLQPLVAGPIVSLVVSSVEKAPVPFEGKTKAGIVAALLAASAGLRVAVAWASGDLTKLDPEDVKIVVGVLVDALVAAGGYALMKANKPVV
jgi:hypothetical protein